MIAALWACFFMSGASALALEALWMRSAAVAFGATAATSAAVLACYFAGLAIGGLAASGGGRLPVRRYGQLELGVAAGAAWSIALFALLASDDGLRAFVDVHPIVQLSALALAVVPTTVCLGATLPTLGQVLARGGAGRHGGLLYGLNTLGATLGAAVAGFGLPAVIGVRASYGVAIVASAAAGAIALAVGHRSHPAEGAQETPSTRRLDGESSTALWLTAATTGALGLGLEVLWMRVFAQVLHNSIYSFTAVAIVFLSSIAAGATLAAVAMRRLPPARVAAAALLVAGVATVAGYWLFVRLTGGLDYVGMESGLGEYVLRIVGLVAVTAGPAALAGAAVLPALWQVDATRDVARTLGRLGAASSAGGAVGALVAGYVVVPALGVRGGLLLAAVAYVGLADLVVPMRGRWRALSMAALLAIVAGDPLRAPLTHLRDAGETLHAMLEGPSGIVTVVDTGSDTQLRLDTFYTLGGSASAANERRQGLVPLLLHPDPHRVAFIGAATGITASAAPAVGVTETTVIELVPEVVEAARAHFRAWNGGVFERSDVRLVVGDGRRHLAATAARFDVIVSDLFIPWHAGAGSLYSREMYATAAARLAPGGLFCQWLPLYQLTREEFDVIARTFLAVFPHVSLWRDDFYPDRPVVALVGMLAPRTVDFERVRARVASVRDALVGSSQGLAMLYAGDLASAADLFAGAPLNTDDRPVIEFLAPRLTRMSSEGDKDWFTGESLAAFYDALAERPVVDGAILPPTDDATSARRAGLALFHYALAAVRNDADAASAYQATVRALVPDVIARAEADQGASSADAEDAIARVHREQSELHRQMSDMEKRLHDLTERRP